MSLDEIIIDVEIEEIKVVIPDPPDITINVDRVPNVIVVAAGNVGPPGKPGVGVPMPVVEGEWIKGEDGAAIWSPIEVTDVAGAEAVVNKDQINGYVGITPSGGIILDKVAAGTPAIQTGVLGDAVLPFWVGARGKHQWGDPVNGLDTNLYRSAYGQLTTDGNFVADALLVQKSIQLDMIGTGYSLYFGPSGDTYLNRIGVNILNTNGNFQAGGSFTSSQSGAGGAALYVLSLAPTGYIIAARQLGDSGWRMLIDANGKISWGNGSGAIDTYLYRASANTLRTDGSLWVAQLLALGSYISANYGAPTQTTIGDNGNGYAGVWFGSAGDAYLYRPAAGIVQTGGQFNIQGNAFVGNNLILGYGVDTSVALNRRAQNVVGMIGSYAQEGYRGAWGYLGYGSGDSQPSVYLRNDAYLLFGPGGTVALDTNLYRSAAGKLRTDGTLDANALTVNGVPVGSGSGMPTGSLIDFAGTAAPSGFLICDGSAVSRSTYSALFAVCGTAYGGGDGSTTFNLPDFRGRVSVGLGPNGEVNALGKSDAVAVGSRTPRHRHNHNLSLPDHAHGFGDPGHTHWAHKYEYTTAGGSLFFNVTSQASGGVTDSVYTDYAGTGAYVGGITSAPGINGNVGPDGNPTDLAPYLVANKIIKT